MTPAPTKTVPTAPDRVIDLTDPEPVAPTAHQLVTILYTAVLLVVTGPLMVWAAAAAANGNRVGPLVVIAGIAAAGVLTDRRA